MSRTLQNYGGQYPAAPDPREREQAPAEFLPPSDEHMPVSSLEAVVRAELDKQIATAKAYPRNFARFMATAKAMVECDAELAAACTYVLPKRKGADDDEDRISGPSVRLAEIVAACWGNLRIAARCVADDGKFLTLQGVAHDLEANVCYSVDLKEGVTYSPDARYRAGCRFSDYMVKNATNAGLAKVSRNATFKVVPRAFVNVIQSHADAVATGDVRSLPERVGKALAWFAAKGVPENRVYAALGVSSRDEMSLDSLRTMNGYKTSVVEGHATLAEIFAPVVEVVPSNVVATTGPKTARLAERLPNGTTGVHPATAADAPPPAPAPAPVADAADATSYERQITAQVDTYVQNPDADDPPERMGLLTGEPAEPFTEPAREPAAVPVERLVETLNVGPPEFAKGAAPVGVPAEAPGSPVEPPPAPPPPFDPTPRANAPKGKGKPTPSDGQKSFFPKSPHKGGPY